MVSCEKCLCIAVLTKLRYLMEIRPCLRAQTPRQRENLSDASNLASGCGDLRLFSCSIPLRARFTTYLNSSGENKGSQTEERFVLRVLGKGGYFFLFFRKRRKNLPHCGKKKISLVGREPFCLCSRSWKGGIFFPKQNLRTAAK